MQVFMESNEEINEQLDKVIVDFEDVVKIVHKLKIVA